ncbi:MAG: hypothetical protein COA78_23025 [Blastopirellula sp.]|nr:MAG: hypothetical protein COA78_23025 [Blastopirellula sp.]
MAAYIKFGDIEGECEDTDHEGWVELNSISQLVKNEIPEGASGAQRSRSTPVCSDIEINKKTDASTPKLMEKVLLGEPIPEVTIHLCQTMGKKKPYLVFKLTAVQITSVSFSDGVAGDPTEDITFSLGTIVWTYTKFDKETFAPQGDVVGGWDVPAGVSKSS